MIHPKGGLLLIALGVATASYALDTDSDSDSDLNQVSRQGKLGFLGGLGALGGLGGTTNLLTHLAQDLLSRSTTSSQVLSLNLTNLVILLVLKAIIFGASSFGLGGYGGHGRSVDGLITDNLGKQIKNKAFISETELLLMLSYLKGDATEKYGCLHRVSCEDPYRAKEYLLAAKMMLKGAEFFNKANSRYNKIVEDLQESISYGLKGQDCSVRYTCERNS